MSTGFQPLSIIYHQNYDIPVPKIHSFVGSKFSDLFHYLQKNYASSLNVITPSSAHLDKLKQVHQIDYINKVEESELTKDYLRLINLPWSDRLRERSFLETEGTLLTAKEALKNKIHAEKVNEEETKNQIKKTYNNSKYVLDPHGAVGLVGLSRYNLKNEIGIFLETAHPIKFRDSITEILDVNIDDPLKLTKDSPNHKIALKNNYSDLVEFVKQSQ